LQQIRPKPPTSAELGGVTELRAALLDKLSYFRGKDRQSAREHDWFVAAALVVRDEVVGRWLESNRRTDVERTKRVYYLSIEYLIGRLLFDALSNLGLVEAMREALAGFDIDFDLLRTLESDAGLGTGGLGRLAACYMESMASLGVSAHGYGIRYDHGLFRQQFTNGWQNETPDDWLANGNPWEFERNEVAYPIRFGGMVEYISGNKCQS
jgi:glycogen phosphorylase